MNRRLSYSVLSIAIAFGLYYADGNERQSPKDQVTEKKTAHVPVAKAIPKIVPEKKEEEVAVKYKLKHQSYRRIVSHKSKKYKVEPALVYAIIKVESNWNARAVSRQGAKGLMQLMPSTARAMEVKDPFNPEENIEGGLKYFRYLLDRFDGNITFALAAYNAGPRRIKEYNGIPPIKETQRYVKKILTLYNVSRKSDVIPEI